MHFDLCNDKLNSCFFYYFSQGISHGCDSSLGGGWMIFFYFHYAFPSLIYCFHIMVIISRISLGFNMLFSCLFSGFPLFSPMGSVTGCDFLIGSFCYSPLYFLSRMHLLFGYYYYDYVAMGVLRPLWFTGILHWISILMFQEIKQLNSIIFIR